MEPDDIGVVLARASELHAKINDAIERALKSEFLLRSGGRSQNIRDSEDASASPNFDSGYGGKDFYGNREGSYGEADGNDNGAVAGDGSTEARSLGAIRDALELLEDQLESLRTVQQQQRSEKEATLGELEESRRILLKRLKDHKGREWEVVYEALAFAGEPVEEREDLPLPPYPMPLSDTSFVQEEEGDSLPSNGPHDGTLKKLSLDPNKAEDASNVNYLVDGNDEDQEEGTSYQIERGRKEGRGLLAVPVGFAKAFLAHAYGITTKVAVVAVSVAAALAISELKERHDSRNSSKSPAAQRLTSPPLVATAHQSPSRRECPPGKKLIIEDGHEICVVRERVELPFPRQINTPDVMYGRG